MKNGGENLVARGQNKLQPSEISRYSIPTPHSLSSL
jgi:hypothetical protein